MSRNGRIVVFPKQVIPLAKLTNADSDDVGRCTIHESGIGKIEEHVDNNNTDIHMDAVSCGQQDASRGKDEIDEI